MSRKASLMKRLYFRQIRRLTFRGVSGLLAGLIMGILLFTITVLLLFFLGALFGTSMNFFGFHVSIRPDSTPEVTFVGTLVPFLVVTSIMGALIGMWTVLHDKYPKNPAVVHL
jgi:uncharacterized RDD family membrane protein YckC